ncbi:hypothetical protein [Bartonella vinsonii]|nr:hypothetical protein [Bartonella vinsonii]
MADSFTYQHVDKMWIFGLHLKPPPVASALALVFRFDETPFVEVWDSRMK